MSLAPSAAPMGITMGCPVGIGPEIIVKLFARELRYVPRPPVVIGDHQVLSACAAALELSVNIVEWHQGEPTREGTLPVYSVSALVPGELAWGKPDALTGQAMARYIVEAVDGVQHGQFAGMVTCPITKTSLNQAGYHFPGHTEMLGHLTGCPRFRMMMAGSRLRVVLVTIHEALAAVGKMLTVEGVADCVRMTVAALQHDFGITTPRVAVAGFNPHAGESGLFGDEEERIIAPAMALCRDLEGISGPWPPDTVFHKAVAGDFDAVVAMYHDQGLIPFKLVHFSDGVNVTLGLPIVRTSVDHGTAYDIAGKGIASETSLAAALTMAVEIAQHRRARGTTCTPAC